MLKERKEGKDKATFRENNMREYEYKGKLHTVQELAEIAGISYCGMCYRLERMSVKEAVEKPKRTGSGRISDKFEYDGKEYTIKELADMADVSYSTMRLRLQKMPVTETLDSRKFIRRKFIYKGEEYSLTRLARLAGTTNSRMICRLKIMSVEDAVNNYKREKERMYEYKGKDYTVRELADMAGISYQAMYQRLLHHPVEQAMELTPHMKHPVLKDGKKKSIKELSEITGLNYSTLSNRLYRGIDIDTALDNRRIVERYEYEGEEHSIPEWSVILGLSESTIRCRMRDFPDIQYVLFPKRKILIEYGLTLDDIRENIGLLDEKSATVIDYTYGITVKSGKNFSEIAEMLGYSREYIRVLHNASMERIAEAVKERKSWES